MGEYQRVTYESTDDSRYHYLYTGNLPTEEEKKVLRPKEDTRICGECENSGNTPLVRWSTASVPV
eukprot:2374756-Prorocentrum_lima.AAC.1